MVTVMAPPKIVVLDPEGEVKLGGKDLAKRVEDLNGTVAGFLDNGGAREYFSTIRELLRQRFELADIIYRTKPVLSRVAPKEMIAELAQKCDFVLVGLCM